MKKELENPIYCKYLRAKNPYGFSEGGEDPWRIAYESNTICWCIKSPGAAGPDNQLVYPPSCVAGRKCFVAPE
jgi:hypothetical protein